ncbi:hypothetical protein QE152_g26973 [Popillia japonica]|uniref:Uncharacterized protein n=1 Tax=Popillia japonica TaxID=7064 RepID=A0AAW1JUZ4_POPJA
MWMKRVQNAYPNSVGMRNACKMHIQTALECRIHKINSSLFRRNKHNKPKESDIHDQIKMESPSRRDIRNGLNKHNKPKESDIHDQIKMESPSRRDIRNGLDCQTANEK